MPIFAAKIKMTFQTAPDGLHRIATPHKSCPLLIRSNIDESDKYMHYKLIKSFEMDIILKVKMMMIS